MSNKLNYGFAERQRREKSAVPTPSCTESLLQDLLLIAPEVNLFDPQAKFDHDRGDIHLQSSPIFQKYQETMREREELQQYKQRLSSELERVSQREQQLHDWCQSQTYPYPAYIYSPYSQEQQHHQAHPQGPPDVQPAYWSDKEVEDLFHGTMPESTSFVEPPQPEQATTTTLSPPIIAHSHLHPSDAFVVQSIAPHLLNHQQQPSIDNNSKAQSWTPDSSPPTLAYSYPHTHADTMTQPYHSSSSPSSSAAVEASSMHSPSLSNLKQNIALPSVPTLQLHLVSTKAPHSLLSPPLSPTSSLPPSPKKARANSSSSSSSTSRTASSRKSKMPSSRKSTSPRSESAPYPSQKPSKTSDIKVIKRHMCDINGCGKIFTRASNLRTHETTHSRSKPFPCDHLGCKSKFARVHDMKRHLRNHTKELPYACVICEDKRFVRNDPLWRHYHHEHKDDPRVPARKRKTPAEEAERAMTQFIKAEEDVQMEKEEDEDTDAEAEDV